MLKRLDPLLGSRPPATSPSIGHGDPAVPVGTRCLASVQVIRLCGISAVRALDAELAFMPVNSFLWPIAVELPIFAGFEHCIAGRARLRTPLAALQRRAFYKRPRKAFAASATGGRRLDHNLLLKKDVIPHDGVPR
jgi:L-fucose mutarotase/ribose pyranase (RbsD/FucU family)